MAISCENTVFTGKTYPPDAYASLIERLTPAYSGILNGCDITVSGNTISCSEGYVIVRGRTIHIFEGSISVPFTSSGTITKYLQVTVNLSNAAAPAELGLVESEGSDTEDFNLVKGTAYFTIAAFEVSASAVTKLSSKDVLSTVSDLVEIPYGTDEPTATTEGTYYDRINGTTITRYRKIDGTWYSFAGGTSSGSTSGSTSGGTSSGSTSGSTSSGIGTYKVTASTLTVRSGPGSSYSAIGYLHKDDTFVALAKSGNWYKLNYSSTKVGYVYYSYVTKVS